MLGFICDEILKWLRRLPCLALAYSGLRLPGEKEEAVVPPCLVQPGCRLSSSASIALQTPPYRISTDQTMLCWPLLILLRRMATFVSKRSQCLPPTSVSFEQTYGGWESLAGLRWIITFIKSNQHLPSLFVHLASSSILQ